ncbi:MAG: type II secretion system F family protein [Pseudomonadales bacterium]|nr:type II secretion system F family protein [Pseudomonadales bacterium]
MAATKVVTPPTFAWKGKDKRGNKVKGEAIAASPAMLKAQLRSQGIAATTVRKKGKPLLGGGGKKITPKDISVFMRQLATMMKAGVPVVQSFDIVSDGLDNPNMVKLLQQVKIEIEGGSTLASSLRSHPAEFDALVCNLIESGEQSGALEQMLDRIATYKEKTEALKAKIAKAIKYPISVLIVAMVVTGILLIKVVPVFEELFQGFGADLPAFTRFVLDISEFVQAWWLPSLFVLFIMGYAYKQAKIRSKKFNDFLDRLSLKLPVMGDILNKAVVARFARTLSTTFAAGVPLVEALETVARASGNAVYEVAIYKVRDEVTAGTQLQQAMRLSGVFPPMAVQMTAIGEESGSLEAMLDKVASYYEDEVDNAVDGLTSMLEPLIMSVLGVLVGGLLIAMYLPIFQMGNAI